MKKDHFRRMRFRLNEARCLVLSTDGAWVMHEDAQSKVDRLAAEVAKWKAEAEKQSQGRDALAGDYRKLRAENNLLRYSAKWCEDCDDGQTRLQAVLAELERIEAEAHKAAGGPYAGPIGRQMQMLGERGFAFFRALEAARRAVGGSFPAPSPDAEEQPPKQPKKSPAGNREHAKHPAATK